MPGNTVDRWDGATWRRVLALDGAPTALAVTERGGRLEVSIDGGGPLAPDAAAVVVRTVLGLDVDVADFALVAAPDPRMAELARRFAGVRPPRLPSPFEALVNGIACQQISLVVGILLLDRLIARFGPERGGEHGFPSPGDLSLARADDLRAIGFSGRKAEYILSLAAAVRDGSLDLDGLSALPDGDAIARLEELPGIGHWTAEYVLLRGLGRLDVFPADDVGGQAKLGRLFALDERPGRARTLALLEPFRPLRGFVYFHLLLDELERRGLLNARLGTT